MGGYPIETNVPVPPVRRGVPPKYPVDQLEPGESFHFPPEQRGAVRSAVARATGRFPGRKYSVRRDTIDNARYRCWRVR